jgi:ribosomal protein S12 methylthiotransferase accessory factor
LGGDAISPLELFGFSEAQHRNRAEWNCRVPDGHGVPEPFDPEEEIEWTAVKSGIDGSPRLVPSAFCYMWHRAHEPRRIYLADTNGCAAGPTWEAAALAALLEAVERDALAIWWDNRAQRPEWPVEAFGSALLEECAAHLQRAGRTLSLLDVTTDIALPVCVAVAARNDGGSPYFASAAGLDGKSAAEKAAGELAAMVALDDERPRAAYYQWVRGASVAHEPYLRPHGVAEMRARPSGAGVEHAINAIRGAGLTPHLLDLTRPEIGIPAVRAVVPGLRHHWGRRGPGRLYDVPARLGWVERARAESELNPVTCML